MVADHHDKLPIIAADWLDLGDETDWSVRLQSWSKWLKIEKKSGTFQIIHLPFVK